MESEIKLENMEVKKEEKMIAKCALKERGWTNSLIEKFLPFPDKLKPNPHYRCAPEMKLYILKRVEFIEKSKDFKKLMKNVKKRKESSKKAVETKLNNLNRYLETISITLPLLPKESLINKACQHYNNMQNHRAYQGLKYSDESACKNSDTLFLERICVNYLRHSLTDYEKELDIIYGKVGFSSGYIEIRNKIFKEISIKYPWLKDECIRQNGEIE